MYCSTISKSVTSVGEDAFANCLDLVEIVAPEGLDLSSTGIMERTNIEWY